MGKTSGLFEIPFTIHEAQLILNGLVHYRRKLKGILASYHGVRTKETKEVETKIEMINVLVDILTKEKLLRMPLDY